jgi:hypothetical protein
MCYAGYVSIESHGFPLFFLNSSMTRSPRAMFSALCGFFLLICAVALAFGWAWALVQAGHGEDISSPSLISRAEALPQPGRLDSQSIYPEATESQDAALAQMLLKNATLPHPDMVPNDYADAPHSNVVHQVMAKDQPRQGVMMPVALTTGPSEEPEKSTRRMQIAIIIDDMGLALKNSHRMTDLPAELTLSYMSYAPDVQAQVDDAKAKGHEIMLHLPMEPLDRSLYPGPGALTTRLSPEQFRANLQNSLDSFKGYVGVNNHMGSRMTADTQAMAVVMDELDRRGKFFIDSWTNPRSVAY